MPKLGYKQTPEHKKHSSDARKGIVFSEETKKKMSIIAKFQWDSGIRKGGWKLSEKTKEKMSLAKKGKTPYEMTEEIRKRMSLAFRGRPSSMGMLGKKQSDEAKRKMSIAHQGKKAWNWIKDRNSLKIDRQKMYDTKYKYWMLSVKKRDHWKCRIADKNCKGSLEAHHILGWIEYPELRYKINNGITLCRAHHPKKRAEEKRLSPYFQELVSVSK
jgi:hypothetical protein